MGGYFSSEPSPDSYESGEDQRAGSSSMEEIQPQSLDKAKRFRKPVVTILVEILRIKGKLNADLVKENNAILKQFLDTFIDEMKLRDPLFAILFSRIYFTGSYYSDLRVSAPDEYDLNLVLKFPFNKSTVSEFELLRKLFSDYLQHNGKRNDKGTRTKDTTNNIQDVKYGNPHCVKRRRRLFHNKHSMCKNMHDSYNNSSINENTLKIEDNINSQTKDSINSNEKMHLNPNKRNFQRRYPEFKKNNNSYNNLDNKSTQEVERRVNYPTKCSRNRNQDVNNENIKFVRFRKGNFQRKVLECKKNENTLCNSGNTNAQKVEKTADCPYKNTEISNQNLNHEKIHFVDLKRSYERRYPEYKSNKNTLCNIDDTKAQTEDKNKNGHIKDLTINNQDINPKKIKSVRHRKRNFRRKHFECQNIDNKLSNIEINKVTPEAKKSTSFSQSMLTKKTNNNSKKLKQKKVQVSKASKTNNNALFNLDNTREQRDEINESCHIKDLKINNQDINHKKLKPVRHRKRNFQRKHSQYKNINSTLNNVEINKVIPEVKKSTNFSQSNLTMPDMLIQDQKCKNENTLTKETNNNKNLNKKKIQVSKARKRNIRRKNFRNKRCQKFFFKVKVNFDESENLFTESNYKNYDELFNDFILNINSHPNGNELKNQFRNQAYVQYHPQVLSYAKYSTTDKDGISEKGLNKLFKDGYLIPNEVRVWLQSVVDKALSTYKYPKYPQKVKNIRTSGSGPARTIILVKADGVIDIDLVPAIHCSMNLKPPGIHGKVYEKVEDNLQCFLIPKPYQPSKQAPVNEAERVRLWRTHYPEAERTILHNLNCAKSVIKLLKLLRDKEHWKILASYYLKTIVMWMVLENSTSDYWRDDRLGDRFMDALKILAENVRDRKIRYFFSSRYNLLDKLTDIHADNIRNRLHAIIKDIEKDPENLWDIFDCPKVFSLI